VGRTGKVAEVTLRKAAALRANPDRSSKLLVSGAPGIGKTSLVNLIARALASHPAAIEDERWSFGRCPVATNRNPIECWPGVVILSA
jgi:Cdc6-like AAA superfamily ATPase